jgi:hypothetical protein
MSTTKETPQVNTVSLDSEERTFGDPQWKTGLKARFPWTGFTALFTILLCANSSVVILLVTDGRKQEPWAQKIGPSVWLSAFNGIANICFGIAIANGVAITWWRKALRGATIKDLHRSWQFSSSIKDVVLYGKYFNFIALAALAAKLTIIDGILLQKAAGFEVAYDPVKMTRSRMFVNETMPATAEISPRSGEVKDLLDWFSTEASAWSQSVGIFESDYIRCNGVCLFHVNGTGFAVDCQTEEIAIDYGQIVAQEALELALANDTLNTDITASRDLFSVDFAEVRGDTGTDDDYSRIEMNITFTNTTTTENNPASCPGTRTRHSCVLRPAIVKYPVTIEDNSESSDSNKVANLYLGLNTTSYGGQLYYTEDGGDTYYKDDVERLAKMNKPAYDPKVHQLSNYPLVAYKNVLEEPKFPGGSTTVVGGLTSVFQKYFGAESVLNFDGMLGGFVLYPGDNAGVYPYKPAHNTSAQGCDYQYSDPLDHILRRINLLMFTLAIDPSYTNSDNNNHSIETTVHLEEYGRSVHYKTNRGFMYGALASILFCVLCVLPSYWGYWQLGRDVTLGPFEIANAFRAPILDHPSVANAGVKVLIREVGEREVKYGEMVHNDASGRLAIAEPEAVRRVHPRIHDRSM